MQSPRKPCGRELLEEPVSDLQRGRAKRTHMVEVFVSFADPALGGDMSRRAFIFDDTPLVMQVQRFCKTLGVDFDLGDEYRVLTRGINADSQPVTDEAEILTMSRHSHLGLHRCVDIMDLYVKKLRDACNTSDMGMAADTAGNLLSAVYTNGFIAEQAIQCGSIGVLVDLVLAGHARVPGWSNAVEVAMACFCAFWSDYEEQTFEWLQANAEQVGVPFFARLLGLLFPPLEVEEQSDEDLVNEAFEKVTPRSTLSIVLLLLSKLPACLMAVMDACSIGDVKTRRKAFGDIMDAFAEQTLMQAVVGPAYPRIYAIMKDELGDPEFVKPAAQVFLCSVIDCAITQELTARIRKDMVIASNDVEAARLLLRSAREELLQRGNLRLQASHCAELATLHVAMGSHSGAGNGRAQLLRKIASQAERVEHLQAKVERLEVDVQRRHKTMVAMLPFIRVDRCLLVEETLPDLINNGWESMKWDSNYTLLHFVAELCEESDVLELVSSFVTDFELRDGKGYRAIDYIRARNRPDLLEVITKLGVPDAVNGARAPVMEGGAAVPSGERLQEIQAKLDGIEPCLPALREKVEACLALGARKVQWDKGFSAAHLAAQRGHIAALKLLASEGADLCAPDDLGLTPLDYAASLEDGRDACIDTLKRLVMKQLSRTRCGSEAADAWMESPSNTRVYRAMTTTDGVDEGEMDEYDLAFGVSAEQLSLMNQVEEKKGVMWRRLSDSADAFLDDTVIDGASLEGSSVAFGLANEQLRHVSALNWEWSGPPSSWREDGESSGGDDAPRVEMDIRSPAERKTMRVREASRTTSQRQSRVKTGEGASIDETAWDARPLDRCGLIGRDSMNRGLEGRSLADAISEARVQRLLAEVQSLLQRQGSRYASEITPPRSTQTLAVSSTRPATGPPTSTKPIGVPLVGSTKSLKASDRLLLQGLAQLFAEAGPPALSSTWRNAAKKTTSWAPGLSALSVEERFPADGRVQATLSECEGGEETPDEGAEVIRRRTEILPKVTPNLSDGDGKGSARTRSASDEPIVSAKGASKGKAPLPPSGGKGKVVAGGKAAKAAARKSTHPSNTRMKKVRWTRNQLKRDTVWHLVNKDDIHSLPHKLLEEEFSMGDTRELKPKAVPTASQMGGKAENSRGATQSRYLLVLETDNAKVVTSEAGFKKMGMTEQELVCAVTELDERLDVDILDILLNICNPTPDQIHRIKEEHSKAPHMPLGTRERFCLAVDSIPSYNDWLTALHFLRSYMEDYNRCMKTLIAFDDIIPTFKKRSVVDVLAIALAVANFVNDKDDEAFPFESLSKFSLLKGRRDTDLNVVVLQVLFEDFPQRAQSLVADFDPLFRLVKRSLLGNDVKRSIGFSLEACCERVEELCKGLDQTSASVQRALQRPGNPAEQLRLRMPKMVKDAEEMVQALQKKTERIKEMYRELVEDWLDARSEVDPTQKPDPVKKIAKDHLQSQELICMWDAFLIPDRLLTTKRIDHASLQRIKDVFFFENLDAPAVQDFRVLLKMERHKAVPKARVVRPRLRTVKIAPVLTDAKQSVNLAKFRSKAKIASRIRLAFATVTKPEAVVSGSKADLPMAVR